MNGPTSADEPSETTGTTGPTEPTESTESTGPTGPTEPTEPTEPTATLASSEMVDAWLRDVGTDSRGGGYGASRSAIFDAVRVDRDGPTTRLLNAYAHSPDPDTRLAVLRLSSDLSPGDEPWPAMVELAENRLDDPDERVRRAAAGLLAAADPERLMRTAAAPPADPVAGLAVVEAALALGARDRMAGQHALARRLFDRHPDPAVRLRAALEVLRLGEPHEWPAAERAILADLDAADRLGGAGSRVAWNAGELLGHAFRRRRCEADCHAWVERLTAEPRPIAVRVGVELARSAMRTWRAAPTRLTPTLVRALAHPDHAVRRAAAQAIAASRTASRAAADPLAELLTDPDLGDIAAEGLARVGDTRALPRARALLRSAATGGELLWAVSDFAADPGQPLLDDARARIRRHDTSSCPGADHRRGCSLQAALFGMHPAGPAAAPAVPELIAALADVAISAGHARMRGLLAGVLGAIGPAARAALPLLEGLDPQDDGRRDADVVPLALIKITGDRHRAEARLDALEPTVRNVHRRVALLDWLVDNGGLAPRHSRLLWAMFEGPRSPYPRVLDTLWRHAGEAAAPAVLAHLPQYLDDNAYGPVCNRVLSELGALAAPALPALDGLLALDERPPMDTGSFDGDMRADERLVELATATRATIRRALET